MATRDGLSRFTTEDDRIVDVDERRVVSEFDFREPERKAAASQDRCGEPLTSKRRKLFDDA